MSDTMTEEWLAPGRWRVTDGEVSIIVGRCDRGCYWLLSPDYRTFGWVAQHGDNPEARLPITRTAPFDPEALLDAVDAWVARVHDYEGMTP